MSYPMFPPYLQATDTPGIYQNTQTGRLLRLPMQGPVYPQHPQHSQYTGMPPQQPVYPRNYFPGPVQNQWNGPNYYTQLPQMQLPVQMQQQIHFQHSGQNPFSPYPPVQTAPSNQRQQTCALPTFASLPPPPQQAPNFPTEAAPQVEEAPPKIAEENALIVIEDDAPSAPELAPPSPSKKKEPSFLSERLRYLKTKIHAEACPIEIRLLRTLELNVDRRQQRRYCSEFWPSNEAALADLHEIAQFSPNFTEIYLFRMRWEAAATQTDVKKIAEEKAKIEADKEELRNTCWGKYQDMLKAERDAQERTAIGTTKGHKSAAEQNKQWDAYYEGLNADQRWEKNVAGRRMERKEKEEKAKRDREEAKLQRKEAAAKKKEENMARKEEETAARKRKREDDKLEKARSRPLKSAKTQHTQAPCPSPIKVATDSDSFTDELAQQMFHELSADDAPNASSPQDSDSFTDELAQQMIDGLSADDVPNASSPPQDSDPWGAELTQQMIDGFSADDVPNASSPHQEEVEPESATTTDSVAKPSSPSQEERAGIVSRAETPQLGEAVQAQQHEGPIVEEERSEEDLDALFEEDSDVLLEEELDALFEDDGTCSI